MHTEQVYVDMNNVRQRRNNVRLNVDFHNVDERRNNVVKMTISKKTNLSRSIIGKVMDIPIYFPWTGKKYSHTLGNLRELVSRIWKLCGLPNSIIF